MNKFVQVLGGGAFALSSICAHAEISYLPNAVFDSQSGLYWRHFETLEQGQSLGFDWASADQTADLFLHYAPPDTDGRLPGYDPEWGGILSYTTSGDGTSYAFTWESTYDLDNYLPPVLSDPFGYNFDYGGGAPYLTHTKVLLTSVSGDMGQGVPVLFRDGLQANQYGWIAGEVEGIIDPTSESLGCPCYYYDVYTGETAEADYYNDDGGLKVAGYLMVSSVPEPSHQVLFLAGIAGIVLRRRITNVCASRF